MPKNEGKTARRIYLVKEVSESGKVVNESLVRAMSQTQAIRHASKGRFSASTLGTEDAIRMTADGVAVQDAGEE